MISPIGSKIRAKIAFTLLEMLLVVVLIMIFLGLSFPRIKNTLNVQSWRLGIDKVYLFLEHARAQSTLLSKVIGVDFDFRPQALCIFDQEEKDRPLDCLSIAPDIKLDLKEGNIIFYPQGGMDSFKLDVCGRDKCLSVASSVSEGKIRITDEE